MNSIYNYTLEELENLLVSSGFKKFNATQVFEWIYKKNINSFDEMTNISKSLIAYLKENFNLNKLKIVEKEESKDTKKYLLKLEDENFIECVLMNHDYGLSLCVSTQVGCNMGCAFCESGRLKKVRNLTVSEMTLEVLTIQNDINTRIHSVVLMGIGEPFDNYDNVIKFIDIITTNKGLDLGSRRVTVSTCGIVPKIKEFTKLNKQVNLALSLHAATDEIRDKIMPINRAYKISEVMDSIDEYINKTNRRVTIEYIMLDGVNDSEECALSLANLLKNKLVYVNLIPYNETENFTYKRTLDYKIKKFYDILKRENINVTIRKEMGTNISGACGQLRAREGR